MFRRVKPTMHDDVPTVRFKIVRFIHSSTVCQGDHILFTTCRRKLMNKHKEIFSFIHTLFVSFMYVSGIYNNRKY